ncbi:pantoate--beta-alanine ligase [Ichthyenterobacterium sp. W332]|uniref:Pantothenate synthetase n=1 Tax=Microcosmobacter mediterraneus TaxID=3075607 RepID=A0ABU2YLD5_9FLAO|nr:pantoate--beta-alanine ligase [Ichthyenterobacterium sp. W332]MDT0557863.1 pantoate--beta-alanine ligase [Ichthyenterobacterium sp. W332]
MKIFYNKKDLRAYLGTSRSDSETVGFVPTMGALHEGHLSLIEKGLSQNALVVVSIFVNPTQFNNAEDLKNYPRTLERDVTLLKTLSKDKIVVYAPTVEDIYSDLVISESFSYDGLEHEMEGKFRAGHFDGVGTIVKRLLDIVEPESAYFGEKDFQQLMIIKKLAEKHNIPVKIVGCKIHREVDGLAMSSRNERLKPEYRNAAPFIYKTLKSAKQKFGTKSANKVTEWVINQFANHGLLELEYFTIADEKTLKPIKRRSNTKKYRAFIAVFADDIRLIDNIALK